MVNFIHRLVFCRFHDKVILEEELNELRGLQATEWELARHHLKVARKGAGLDAVDTLTTILDKDLSEKVPKDPEAYQPLDPCVINLM